MPSNEATLPSQLVDHVLKDLFVRFILQSLYVRRTLIDEGTDLEASVT